MRAIPRVRAFLLCAAIAMSAAAGAQSPQTPQTPVFRTGTALVRVDTVVVDEAGRPVSGLTSADFEILDRGVRRNIGTFEELSYTRPPVDMNAQHGRLDVASNDTAATDRRVILVVDEPRVMISRTDRAREVARRIVLALGGRVQMAILRTNGKPRMEFTKDTAALLDTIEDVRGERTYFSNADGINWNGEVMMSQQTFTSHPSSHYASPTMVIPNLSDQGLFPVMRDAARALSYDSGRRTAMIVISEGMPTVPVPTPELQRQMGAAAFAAGDEVSWLVTSARRANVAVYAIDPRGDGTRLGAEGYADAMYGGAVGLNQQSWIQPNVQDVARLSQRTLQDMTSMTGGFAFVGSNNFEAGANKVLDELDHYYLLGFEAEDLTSTAPREITVRMKRPGLSVRFRRFYSTALPPMPATAATTLGQLRRLVSEVTPMSGLRARLFATVVAAPDGSSRVAIAASTNSGRDETVDFALWAVDMNAEKMSKQDQLPLQFVSGAPVRYLALSPGRYQLRLAAMSRTTQRGGSTYLAIDVPNFKKTSLGISSIVLASSRGIKPTVSAAFAVAPTMTRSFTPPETLRVAFSVWSKKPRPFAKATVEILDLRGRVLMRAAPSIGANGDVVSDILLPALQAGRYRVRTLVADGKDTASREVGFVIDLPEN